MKAEINQRITRRAFLKRLIGGGVAAAAGTPIYAYFVERNWLDITRITIPILSSPELAVFRGTSIVHFSDMHIGHYCGMEEIAAVASRIEQLKPDIICFTGDLVDQHTAGIGDYVELMSGLTAPLGKYAILGNHDYYHDAADVRNFWSSAGFELLDNRHAYVEKEGQRLYIAGLDDLIYGTPDMEGAMQGIAHDRTVILLAHEPDYADKAAKWPQIKLQLSGHSHGGQIRLPLIGHLIAPPQGKKYVSGLYRLTGSDLHIYTNRGTGTTILPFRLFCRPEITVIELE
ncbi:metallophosphoesterase [Paenibacillus oenotherae]|uniref:Metallophosphoesterase n=1 Tax=Paenibacillus oenotherae TaxID=1435645 RepID=A0ABS7D452_9BACL|nr:metallophosphoesterase [Paenibacillus oenotherae]MBW7474276.1 metallophosphoesterase [Paenibacillus oenotherae]